MTPTTNYPCHAQLLAMTIRVIWLVGFSVEVLCLVSFNKRAGEASLLKIAFSGFDIAVFSSVNYTMLSQMVE